MNELLTWITFAVVQLILVVFAGFYTWRRPVDRGRWLGVFLIVGAMVLLVLNAAWVLTGGPEGVSAIPMRGGVLGFWLSTLTGLEILVLGLVVMARVGSRG